MTRLDAAHQKVRLATRNLGASIARESQRVALRKLHEAEARVKYWQRKAKR